MHNEDERESVGQRTRRMWREWLRPFLTLALLLFSFRSALADWNDVPSGSMMPTILEGDRIFVNRAAYDLKVPFTLVRLARWADPQRGDVVVLVSPVDGRRLVKRVVGVPGDLLEVRGERLLVNGEAATYQTLELADRAARGTSDLPSKALARETVAGRSHRVMAEVTNGPASDIGPVRVPEGRYFLMGDHRDASYDSRFWGFAERRAILGRVEGIAVSLDWEHHLAPRWGRFFSRLDS
jgi:signal peptidase I